MKSAALILTLLLAGCGDRQVTAFECHSTWSITGPDGAHDQDPQKETFVLDRRSQRLFNWDGVQWLGVCDECKLSISDKRIVGDNARQHLGERVEEHLAFDRVRGTGYFRAEQPPFNGIDNEYRDCRAVPVPSSFKSKLEQEMHH